MKLKQLILSSGDEIIADIVSWDSDQEQHFGVMQNPIQLVFYDADDGNRYFGLKPYMTFQEPNEYQVFNKNHVISIMNPSDTVLKQYHDYVSNMKLEVPETMDQNFEDDSSDSNVIAFKPTVH